MSHAVVLGKQRSVLVAAVDLSEASVMVFEAALEIAHDAPHAEIHIVHVASPRAAAAKSEKAIDALASWAERLPEHGAKVELHSVEGASPDEAIVAFAASVRADLILIGTHGRRGLSRAILGSVAESVVRTAGCSVLVVRAKSHAGA